MYSDEVRYSVNAVKMLIISKRRRNEGSRFCDPVNKQTLNKNIAVYVKCFSLYWIVLIFFYSS